MYPKYPKNLSESELTFVVFDELRNHFPHIRTEVKISKRYTPKGERGVRLDIVVYDENKKPIFVIEVKRNKGDRKVNLNTKQLKRYKRILSVPVYKLAGYKHIQRELPNIIDNHKK